MNAISIIYYYYYYLLVLYIFEYLQTLTHMRIMVNLIVSLMLSMLYVNSGEDANKVLDNYNLLFSLIMHLVMSSMMLNVLTGNFEFCHASALT